MLLYCERVRELDDAGVKGARESGREEERERGTVRKKSERSSILCVGRHSQISSCSLWEAVQRPSLAGMCELARC